MNLHKEFNRFIRDDRYRITYVRRNTQIRCKCADCGGPNPNCPICYGTGYQITIEHPYSRRSPYWGSDSMHGLEQIQPLGYVNSDTWVYYLAAQVQPKEFDLIIDTKRYWVRRVHLERDGAEIAFYRVVADTNVGNGPSK
jgi:hypothetical protein